MGKVVNIKPTAKDMLEEVAAMPGVTKCIIVADGDDWDCPVYYQCRMTLTEMTYYAALITKEAIE